MPHSAAQQVPNLWHLSALVWGTSLLLISLFAMPISFNPLGIRLQLCLTAAHLGGVFYLWRLAAKRGNPERLMDIAIITLVFIYLVPLCMFVAPVMVLAAYAMPGKAWLTVMAIMTLCAAILTMARLWSTATDKNTGHRFEVWLAEEMKGDTISTNSISVLLSHVGRHATDPTRIDGWSMVAAIATGLPILNADIAFDRSSSSLALCAVLTTPMAMHAFSRMAVHAYLWIFRLNRFEREVGTRIAVNLRDRS
ncbi:hypothetical protein [Duganella sp. Root1480D1]|uniref:hypothetical protein n=1 Tax=Duganella sp. Root1480D1 TaxID=1736471 RepID=UPI000A916D37|nr:hypothetical protein [Duganella sp. Root1480D1]